MSFIWFILIGLLSGFIAGKLMRGGGFGLVINLIVGVVGGVLGGWLFGAVVLLWIVGLLSRGHTR